MKKVYIILIGLGILAPFLYIEVAIVFNAVNLPYQDSWSLVPVFQAIHHNEILRAFTLLWHQHNEHRVFFPNLVSVLVALITKWNQPLEMVLDALIALMYFIILSWFINKATANRIIKLIAMAITSLIIFSPIQWENWLWGWQIEWFMCILLGIASLTLLDYRIKFISKNKSYALAALLCFIASFSLGNGLVFWITGLISLVINKHSPKKVYLWISGFVLSLSLYLYNYTFLSGGNLHQNIISYLEFFLGYIGAPFSSQHAGMAITLGLIILSISGLLLYKAIKIDGLSLRLFTIPIGLIVFVIISDVLTAHARLGIFGINGALASRYTSVSLLYIVAILLILIQLKLSYFNWAIIVTLLIPFIVASYVVGQNQLHSHSVYFISLKKCLNMPTPSTLCLSEVYPSPGQLNVWIKYLETTKYGGFN